MPATPRREQQKPTPYRRNYGHDEGRKFRQESLRMREDSTLDLDDARALRGSGWDGDLDDMRASRAE